MEAGFIDIICALQLSDHWLHDNLKRLDLVVANDQLNKGIRYVKGGHLDTATLDVRRVRHEVHGKLLIAAVVVASRKTNQYRRRVCFTLAEDGRVLTWLPPPFSQCAASFIGMCAHISLHWCACYPSLPSLSRGCGRVRTRRWQRATTWTWTWTWTWTRKRTWTLLLLLLLLLE